MDTDQTLNQLALHFKLKAQQLVALEEWKAVAAILDTISFLLFGIASIIIISTATFT
jgi:hypothetical protein